MIPKCIIVAAMACVLLASSHAFANANVHTVTAGKQLKTATDFVGPNCLCASTKNFQLANCGAPVQLTITPVANDFQATYECPSDGNKVITTLRLDGNHTDEILPNGQELDIYAWLKEPQNCGVAFKVGPSAETQVEIIVAGVCNAERCQAAFTDCRGEADNVVVALGANSPVQRIGA